jgi:hypothetical protein
MLCYVLGVREKQLRERGDALRYPGEREKANRAGVEK